MSVRIRHHVNPMKVQLLHIAPGPLRLPAGSPPALEVELGCADALFLFELARRDPETSYVGVELRRELVRDVNRRAAAEGLAHLRAVFAHINIDLPSLLGGYKVRRFFINFPDPWFKRAQKKRRVVTPELCAQLVELLVEGGELFFQSDVWDLALDAMAVLETTTGLYNVAGEWSFLRGSPYPARSLREVRVGERGLPVWRMLYRTGPKDATQRSAEAWPVRPLPDAAF
jgi:tRNA (guanine-N7-)-methyltransferase